MTTLTHPFEPTMLLHLNQVAMISCLHLLVFAEEIDELRKFPKDFVFGAGSAAYQIEGAWNADGKGESMWDHMVHTNPDSIMDRSNADVASNSYYFYKQDVAILKDLGVQFYRFSISWPRILPNGRIDYINKLGIDHYNKLIDELLANGIQPFVTIYHWDLPQVLSQRGGWLNQDIVDWFGEYASVLFKNFGNRVKYWLTVNEPYIHCNVGYDEGKHAPGFKYPGIGVYECTRNMLLANARAYRIYESEFKAKQKGRVGLALSSDWAVPATDSEDDAEAVRDYLLFTFDLFASPIFSKEGNFPATVSKKVANKSASQGFKCSRLRPLTQEQVEYIRGSADFLGLNHYNTQKVYRNVTKADTTSTPSLNDDADLGIIENSTLLTPQTSGYSPGLTALLVYIKDKYSIPIFITENGYSSEPGLDDDGRVNYFRNYLNATLIAISAGVDVRGYFAWSLEDNFEWTIGYMVKYGLYEVDFEDPQKTRTARKSALRYKEIVRTRTID